MSRELYLLGVSPRSILSFSRARVLSSATYRERKFPIARLPVKLVRGRKDLFPRRALVVQLIFGTYTCGPRRVSAAPNDAFRLISRATRIWRRKASKGPATPGLNNIYINTRETKRNENRIASKLLLSRESIDLDLKRCKTRRGDL